jgi:FlaA1/EpsC-like NDP-sugar epimerase
LRKIQLWKKLSLVIIDITLINFSFLLSFYFRFLFDIPEKYLINFADHAIIITLIFLIFFYFFKFYDSLWHYASIDEFLLATAGCICGGIAALAYSNYFNSDMPNSVLVLATIFITLFVVGFRITFRIYRRLIIILENKQKKSDTRVMIVGAGSGGNMILREMISARELDMVPVCFVDDSSNKQGMVKSGVKVMGTRYDIPRLVEDKKIQEIIISIPSISGENKAELINICKKTGCKLKIIPGIYELINGDVTINNIRDVNVEDLLGRDPVKLEDKGIKDYIKGKVVMITGGGGSIGSEIARQVIKYEPAKLIIFDIYENNAYEIENEIKRSHPGVELKVIIGSVRDRRRLENVFRDHKPQVVFHAAAHKHVPLMEASPSEAVKNNVFGTLNLAETADKYNVEKFVMVSTDKAVNPTNVMGATKRICEMIIQAMDAKSKTEFGAVRFGNVLGSNGSVIPLFNKQIAMGGPVTVTDKYITRFFMTIPEASQLVLQAGAFARGGEIFILDMGEPVKIYELAKDLIRLSGFEPDRDIKIEVTGLRPGEKLYEEVLMSEEGMSTTGHNKIFVARPSHYNIEELKIGFQELKFLCEVGNKEEIVRKLQEIVPTYHKSAVDVKKEYIIDK